MVLDALGKVVTKPAVVPTSLLVSKTFLRELLSKVTKNYNTASAMTREVQGAVGTHRRR